MSKYPVRDSLAVRLRRQLAVGIVPKGRLPGDTPGLVRALHALNVAGLLEPNCYGASETTRPCPRCGRQTAVWRYTPVWVTVALSVCTGCRSEEFGQLAAEWNRSAYGKASDQ